MNVISLERAVGLYNRFNDLHALRRALASTENLKVEMDWGARKYTTDKIIPKYTLAVALMAVCDKEIEQVKSEMTALGLEFDE